MKTNKIFVVALSLLVLISIAACTPRDTGFNNNTDRLSTQTRLNQNNNWNRDDSWDNGMNMNTTIEDDLNNGINNNRTNNLNNGMVRNNSMTTSLGNMNTQAKNLAKKISNLPEVDNASVVLSDNNCIVGVDLKGTNNTISTSLRQKIEKMVKDTNNINTTDVSITSDPDLITRVKTLSNGMTNNVGNTVGNDVNDFTNDIEELIRDMVPGGRGRN